MEALAKAPVLKHSAKWLLLTALAFASYLLSAAWCLDFTSRTVPTDVEQLDSLGREPALGPRVRGIGRLICPPRGPAFLWSRDYAGDEWLWSFYRPVVRLWFATRATTYYNVYEEREVLVLVSAPGLSARYLQK